MHPTRDQAMTALSSWSVIWFAVLGQLTTGLRLEVQFLHREYPSPDGWLPQISADTFRFDIELGRERSGRLTIGDRTLDANATLTRSNSQGFTVTILATSTVQKWWQVLPRTHSVSGHDLPLRLRKLI